MPVGERRNDWMQPQNWQIPRGFNVKKSQKIGLS
jgi:hypothetical protein